MSESFWKITNTLFFFPFSPGKETIQSREATFQRGSRDAKGSAAPKHRAVLWLLGITSKREEMHRSCDRANDFRDTKDVRICLELLIITSAKEIMFFFFFLHQGFLFCFPVSNMTQNIIDGFWYSFLDMSAVGPEISDYILGVVWITICGVGTELSSRSKLFFSCLMKPCFQMCIG